MKLLINSCNRNKTKTTRLNKAFTLIELLVVIFIIALLASIVAVQVNKARSKARDAKRKADVKTIATVLELYYDEYNTYAVTGGWNDIGGGWFNSEDGVAYTTSIAHALENAGMISSAPIDPSGNEIFPRESFH
ncbi:MAG: hypothetical protein COU81_00725 [Candidatus Portnoybacteria bacterium CG10_big_fil_rev_8_21_14_0_10_36_7]|uniref:Type II secretion system protein GspG C-terminal domain-containing protein n=1 Tax=Candidatus Portnoybacteria bacterium CG10_big_fil_rev_8_21_14_0_10_36_7 TaxID=1974812 RepID=A0A2M8KET9_9BACT|nr:MAG: hypothetical protein COU81_00725 [Candidatus Portnoybacteria bacterium CG10_big_fil_rev_8_21_14_0_10_36_7]